MKKLLLSLVGIFAMVMTANAETSAFYASATAPAADKTIQIVNGSSNNLDGETFAAGDVSIKFIKVNSTALNVNSNLVRWYKEDKIEITPGENVTITDIVINCSTNAYAKATAQIQIGEETSNLTVPTDSKGTQQTWTGESSELTTLIANGGQVRFSSLVITYDVDSSDTREAAGLEFTTKDFTVEYGDAFTAPELTNPNNLPVTYSSSNTDVADVAADGAVTIKAAGNTTITAEFAGNDDFKPGKASYTLSVIGKALSIAAAKNIAEGTEFIVGFPLTVAFVNYSNIFATDGTDWIQIYGSNEYAAGDIIPAGWVSTYKNYNSNTPELLPVGALPESTTSAELSLKEYSTETPTVANVNEVLILKNVVLAEASPATKTNFNGKFNGETIALRNNYTLASVEAGTYDIKTVVSIYNNSPSFYVIEYLDPQTENPVLAAPVISPADGAKVPAWTLLEITAPEGATVYYKTSMMEEFEEYEGWVYVIGTAGSTFSVEAYAELDGEKSEIVKATFTISKADRGLSWINLSGEPVEEVVYIIGESTDEVFPLFDGMADGELTLTSSDPEVATAEIDWNEGALKVTPLKAGTTVITLTVAEDDTYDEGSASYTLIVVDPSSQPTEASFDFANGLSDITFIPALEENFSSGVQIKDNKIEVNGVQLSFDGSKNSNGVKLYGSEGSWTVRIYSGNSMTVTAPANMTLNEITFTKNGDFNIAASAGTMDDNVWTPASVSTAAREAAQISSVTFTANGGQLRFKALNVELSKIGTGIEGVSVDSEDAPVEYFNLQGVRVANPENGLYIRRQGNKTTKVIIR